MKISVPLKNVAFIDDHFGHCEAYGIFTVNDQKQIVEKEIIYAEQGCGCKSNIASVLADNGVTVMLAGGIGGGAIQVLNNAGITVIKGCSGLATEAALQYVNGTLTDSGESCQHHDHHHH